MTPPLMPSPWSKKSGLLEARVAEHIDGADSKPAQRALKTAKDSN